MDGNGDNEQTNSACYHGFAAAEKHLETLLACSVSCRIAPIELSTGLNEETKLRRRAADRDKSAKSRKRQFAYSSQIGGHRNRSPRNDKTYVAIVPNRHPIQAHGVLD